MSRKRRGAKGKKANSNNATSAGQSSSRQSSNQPVDVRKVNGNDGPIQRLRNRAHKRQAITAWNPMTATNNERCPFRLNSRMPRIPYMFYIENIETRAIYSVTLDAAMTLVEGEADSHEAKTSEQGVNLMITTLTNMSKFMRQDPDSCVKMFKNLFIKLGREYFFPYDNQQPGNKDGDDASKCPINQAICKDARNANIGLSFSISFKAMSANQSSRNADAIKGETNGNTDQKSSANDKIGRTDQDAAEEVNIEFSLATLVEQLISASERLVEFQATDHSNSRDKEIESCTSDVNLNRVLPGKNSVNDGGNVTTRKVDIKSPSTSFIGLASTAGQSPQISTEVESGTNRIADQGNKIDVAKETNMTSSSSTSLVAQSSSNTPTDKGRAKECQSDGHSRANNSDVNRDRDLANDKPVIINSASTSLVETSSAGRQESPCSGSNRTTDVTSRNVGANVTTSKVCTNSSSTSLVEQSIDGRRDLSITTKEDALQCHYPSKKVGGTINSASKNIVKQSSQEGSKVSLRVSGRGGRVPQRDRHHSDDDGDDSDGSSSSEDSWQTIPKDVDPIPSTNTPTAPTSSRQQLRWAKSPRPLRMVVTKCRVCRRKTVKMAATAAARSQGRLKMDRVAICSRCSRFFQRALRSTDKSPFLKCRYTKKMKCYPKLLHGPSACIGCRFVRSARLRVKPLGLLHRLLKVRQFLPTRFNRNQLLWTELGRMYLKIKYNAKPIDVLFKNFANWKSVEQTYHLASSSNPSDASDKVSSPTTVAQSNHKKASAPSIPAPDHNTPLKQDETQSSTTVSQSNQPKAPDSSIPTPGPDHITPLKQDETQSSITVAQSNHIKASAPSIPAPDHHTSLKQDETQSSITVAQLHNPEASDSSTMSPSTSKPQSQSKNNEAPSTSAQSPITLLQLGSLTISDIALAYLAKQREKSKKFADPNHPLSQLDMSIGSRQRQKTDTAFNCARHRMLLTPEVDKESRLKSFHVMVFCKLYSVILTSTCTMVALKCQHDEQQASSSSASRQVICKAEGKDKFLWYNTRLVIDCWMSTLSTMLNIPPQGNLLTDKLAHLMQRDKALVDLENLYDVKTYNRVDKTVQELVILLNLIAAFLPNYDKLPFDDARVLRANFFLPFLLLLYVEHTFDDDGNWRTETKLQEAILTAACSIPASVNADNDRGSPPTREAVRCYLHNFARFLHRNAFGGLELALLVAHTFYQPSPWVNHTFKQPKEVKAGQQQVKATIEAYISHCNAIRPGQGRRRRPISMGDFAGPQYFLTQMLAELWPKTYQEVPVDTFIETGF